MPTPEQLFRISGVVTQAAREQEKLRPGLHYDNARFMRIEPLYFEGECEVSEEFYDLEHRLIGHIRRIAPDHEQPRRRWSLRLCDSLWSRRGEEDETAGIRTMYSFEWTEEVALKSLRTITAVPTPPVTDFMDDIQNFKLRDDSAYFLDADMQMEAVNSSDCEIIEAEVRSLCEQSRQLTGRD